MCIRDRNFSGANTQFLPENAVIQVLNENNGKEELVTLMRNNGRTNITSLFNEKSRLLPEENTVSVAKGIIGSYPNVFLRVSTTNIREFVDAVLAMQTADDYEILVDVYGVRRTDKDFWAFSDKIHQLLLAENPIEYGRLDYGRLENR